MISNIQNTALVSVIIPCYNQGMFLAEALSSIHDQTYDNWECIIVNDGSDDHTEEVAKLYVKKDARFRYLSIENKGLSHARNLGIKSSSGKFIQFLDADDLLETEKLKSHVEYLEHNNEVGLIYGEARYFTSENKLLRNYSMHQQDVDWMPRISGKGKELVNALLKGNIFPINSAMLRKSLLATSGVFDESLSSLEDWDLWIRFALLGVRFQWIDSSDTMALIRVHSISMSQNKKKMRSHVFPLLQRNLFNTDTNFRQKIYLFVRCEEELTNVLLSAFKERPGKILLSKTNSILTFLFLLCFVIPFFPFYILIKIYRLIFNK